MDNDKRKFYVVRIRVTTTRDIPLWANSEDVAIRLANELFETRPDCYKETKDKEIVSVDEK